MNLIGRNKIAEYMLKRPEARIPLLTFLKEFPYRPDRYVGDIQDVIDGAFQVDGFDCIIKVRINHFAKAINIIQLSNRETEISRWEKACKEQEMKAFGQKELTKTVSFVVPPPPDLEEIKQNKTNANLFNLEVVNWASHQRDFYSEAEYVQCLNRVNAIFEVKSGVPEFEELLNLLPRIFNYEEYKLKFPKLKIFELVKNRMDLFSITPGNLGQLAGSEDELNLFLSGKLRLKDEVLTRLFNILAIRSPVTDQRFL